jgi:hypothetical protein
MNTFKKETNLKIRENMSQHFCLLIVSKLVSYLSIISYGHPHTTMKEQGRFSQDNTHTLL